MEREKWQKGIGGIKNIRLSKEEKATVLGNILPNKQILWISNPWLVFMRVHSVALLSLFVVCLGGYVAVASEKALPGEAFYGIKVNVTEPARDLIKIIPEEKIDWQEEKAKRRIEEVELLVATDKINEDKKEKIENLFEKHKEEFRKISEEEIEKKEAGRIKKQESGIVEEKTEIEKVEKEEREENSRKSKREDLEKRLEERLKKLEEAKEKALEKRSDRLEKRDRDSR